MKSTFARSVNVRLLVSLVALCLVFGLGAKAFGQRLDGTLRGEAKDTTGAMVVDVKVMATNEQTNSTATTSTTSAGTYAFPNLLVGRYTVVFDKQGFKKYVRKGVEVKAAQVTEVTAPLEVGAESVTVEVTAGAEFVQTTSSQLTTSFNEAAAKDLPVSNMLNGSILDLALLAPNATSQPGGMVGDGGAVAGNRPRGNNFTVDGVDNNDSVNTGHLANVIGDAVAEFNITAAQYAAEYGSVTGGQFALVTKSGTNSWHGEGYWLNNNRDFNAMNNIEHADPILSSEGRPARNDVNRFGGNVGGPIIKNKVFIFGAYERNVQGLAPTPTSFNSVTSAGLATLNGMPLNPTVKALLALFPVAPTADQGTVTVNGQQIPIGTTSIISPVFFNEHQYQINADIQLTKHRVSTRYLYDRQRAPNTNPQQPQPNFTGDFGSDTKKGIVADAWTINSRLVNDLRFSYARTFNIFGVAFPSIASIDGGTSFPNIEIDQLGSNLGPEGNSPQGGTQNIYNVVDGMTLVKGRHAFKWGLDWKHYINPQIFLPRARGEYDYATLNEFINDQVPSGANGALRGVGSGVWSGNQNAASLYFQDDLKVSRRLTLNLGIRWEWMGNPRDANVQGLNGLADCPECTNMPFMGPSQVRSSGIIFRNPRTDYNNWAPRLGFAYDPTGSGKWSIRGGAGVSYSFGTFQNLQLLQFPPEFQAELNPILTCGIHGATRPAWATPAACANVNNINTNNFLNGGALPDTLVPPVTQVDARNLTGSFITDQVQPKVFSWSLGVQHELFKSSTLEVRYIGTRGLELPVQQRINLESIFEKGFKGLPEFLKASDIPATMNGVPTRAGALNLEDVRFPGFPADCIFDPANPGACDPGFGGLVTAFPALGSSIYHAGSVDFIHRAGHGLYLRTNYTFSKTIDNSSNELFSSRVNPRRAQDPNNFGAERGLSAMDFPHKFTLAWVYEAPKLGGESGFAKALLHGWQYNGSFIVESGQPITALADLDVNGDFDTAGDRAYFNPNGVANTATGSFRVCNDGAGGATRIASTGQPACPSGNTVGYIPINTNAMFIQPGLGVISNLGRNTVRSPGFQVWNMSLFKNTHIGERFNLQFRVETYNTFNHRNFSISAPSSLGTVVASNALSTSYPFVDNSLFLNEKQFNGGSRQMQLGLKLIF